MRSRHKTAAARVKVHQLPLPQPAPTARAVLSLDMANECVRRGEQAIPLTAKAFAVLRYLVEHHRSYGRPLVQAIIQEKFSKRADRRHFLRGVLWNEEGVFKVRTTGDQGSGILTSMVKANCLIDIPTEIERVNPGDTVTVQLLTGSAWSGHAGHQSSSSHRLSCC